MFPDSSILEYLDLYAFKLKVYSDSLPFTKDDNFGKIYDEIVNKLFVASLTMNQNQCRQKKV